MIDLCSEIKTIHLYTYNKQYIQLKLEVNI